MNEDLQDLEASLAVLKPAGLDPAFISRLVACAEGHGAASDAGEQRLEKDLRHHRPAALPPGMLGKLTEIAAGTAFPLDEKILLFPKPAAVPPAAERRRPLPMVAAAAAVALCGAAAALLFPADPPAATPLAGGPAGAESAVPRSQPAGPGPASRVLPASFDRDLRSTRDEGVVWHSRDGSHRVLRIEYIDRVSVTDQSGKTIEIEQPRVQYLIVPERID
jgi:hypothetical protein